MEAPGQRKFKLRRLKDPIYNKKLDITYEFICDELHDAKPCTHCRNGMISVAYGLNKGIWDVYSFPCSCIYPNGFEWWQCADLDRFKNRPVEYQCKQDDLPGHVFIHPVHRKPWQNLLKHIGQIRERQRLEQEDDVPF